ncbi:MAG: CRTAC1 family protein [Planctomycetaceae bacterium]|nr:CRTAC1 family protein [Planctomycetaceae bacterium]
MDAAPEAGLSSTYHDGSQSGCYELIESVGGGAASFDFDRDGRQDLFFTGGGDLTPLSDGKSIRISGRSGHLLRHCEAHRFEDVTQIAGVDDHSLYTHGCTILDCDADGFDDLLVAGYGGLRLWLNRGDGTLQERAAELGLISNIWNVSAAAADYDRDGFVDVYVLTYAEWAPDIHRTCLNDQQLRDICGPTSYPGSRDALFRNTGAGFTDVRDQVGLAPGNRGLGLVAADIDNNGYIDFAVVNDVEENQLYLNDADSHFREEAVLWGIAYSHTGEREGSMGIDLGDFDNDGFPDLWYTNYAQQDNSLLRNAGGSGFVHSASLVGLAAVSRQWVGFGTLLTDFDGDGWDDLFVANGHVAYERRDSPYYQPPQLFRNNQGRRFVEVTRDGGPYFDGTWSGRGALKTDVNEDGAWDLVVVHQNEPAVLLRNRLPPKSWIRLDLIGTHSDRNAVGAVVSIRQGEHITKRWKPGGGSYLSHSDPRVLFPLVDDTPVDVTVLWLGRQAEEFRELSTQCTHVLVEGRRSHAIH